MLAVPNPTSYKTRARAPLRLGLAGGGTDLSPYCDIYGGAVLNVTIDRYAFASFIQRDDDKIVFEADDVGIKETFDPERPVDHELILHRGVYERMIAQFNGGRRMPMTIKTTVDAPPGSGLGSSSALVVALVEGMGRLLGAPLGKYDVAHVAFEIERQDLALSGGRQDQYAAAFGGINYVEFFANDRVIVNPLRVSEAVYHELESSIVICFSGRSRSSAAIIDKQTSGIRAADIKTIEAMHRLKSDADEMKRALLLGKIDEMAHILNKSWASKKATAEGVATTKMTGLLDAGLANGALAGKVSGAGGGGFLFFLVHPENRHRLIQALTAAGGQASPTKFTSTGCETWQFA